MTYFDPTKFADAIRAFKAHAVSAWPKEACGVLLIDGTYRPLANISGDPENSFDCGDERAPLIIAGQVAAMLHSHPYPQSATWSVEQPENFGPSAHDMRQQIADGFPWGIAGTNGLGCTDVVFWGDTIPPVPVEGRNFRHGPTGTDGRGDCYALIRDYYRHTLKIDLPEGPRDAEWWKHKEDLYLENMARAGFRVIASSDAKPGDVFFAQVNASVPNHGGILIQGGLILHHLSGRISRAESLLPWRRHIVRWIRHAERD